MDNPALTRSYVLTWNAMMLRERSVLFRRGLPFDELSEDSDIGLKMLEGAALAGRALDASSGDVPVDPLVPPVMLDSAVIDFLSGLYPLLAAEHRHSWPVERLRDAFAGLRQLYPDEFGRSSYPTGHVVAMIMQCLEDLDISGLSDDVELQIEFALDRERDLITTTCDIVVSTECMLLLQREIPAWTWSEDYMGEAGLDVRLSAE
ncbi:hypothetical protein VNI00_013141 [Paramarasmius palmivorus]|uniref:Uncharacterized protein n=1 Tax=Paramarasmius palmivorus TaxID=297713 RepID=A0AAW0C0E2_9AGAR